MRWSLLFGSSLLALSAIGCGNGNEAMTNGAEMLQGGSQAAATAGMTAGGIAGSTPPPSSSGAGSVASNGGVAGISGGSGSTASGSGTGGASAGGGTGGASAAAGAGGSTAGAAGASGDGAAGAAGGAGMAAPMHEDLGKGDGRDVVLIGDSYMSNTLQIEGTGGGISPSLQRASGQPYRNYAVQGVMLLSASLFGAAIPSQWDSAKRLDSDIKTVVMTGGGNDVIQNPGLQSDCEMNGAQCMEFRMNLIAALDKLWTQMATDGVQDIIYVRYASNASSTPPPMDPMMAPMRPAICTSGKVRCHSLDTTDLVNGEIAGDGIHPLSSANNRIAKAIVDLMEAQGMRR